MTIKTENHIVDLISQSTDVKAQAPSKPIIKERNYGIDFLRLLSMFYVVLLHSLRQCGITDATEEGTAEYIACWFMQICAYGAVNIFAVISGYVGYSEREKPVKYSSWFNLWLQVVFYGAVIGFILSLINDEWVTADSYIKAFFPVSNNMYWYFTSYTGLFLVMPLLNAGVRGTSKKNLKVLFVFMIVLFSVVDVIFKGQKFNSGYSFGWLAVLYLMGAVMKKCDIGKNMKAYVAFAVIAVLDIICLLWKLYGKDFDIFDYSVTKSTFISYLSPVMVIGALLHVIAFSKISFGKYFSRLIAFAAPCSFAVYLINTERHLWDNVMKNLLVALAEEPWYLMAFKTIIFAAGFVVFAVYIDRIRMLLFRFMRINKLTELLEKGINTLSGKLIKDE